MQAEQYLRAVTRALRQLNYEYGHGSLELVDIVAMAVTCQLQYGTKTRKFCVKNNTVYYAGHQLRITFEVPK